jgi:hypothetical protein
MRRARLQCRNDCAQLDPALSIGGDTDDTLVSNSEHLHEENTAVSSPVKTWIGGLPTYRDVMRIPKSKRDSASNKLDAFGS